MNFFRGDLMVMRGEIYFAQLNPVQGSEQGGMRPVLIIQNDIGNAHSPTTIVLAITSQINKARLPTHVELRKEESGLQKDSVILAEQIRTIDKARLKQKIAVLQNNTMQRIAYAMAVSVGLYTKKPPKQSDGRYQEKSRHEINMSTFCIYPTIKALGLWPKPLPRTADSSTMRTVPAVSSS